MSSFKNQPKNILEAVLSNKDRFLTNIEVFNWAVIFQDKHTIFYLLNDFKVNFRNVIINWDALKTFNSDAELVTLKDLVENNYNSKCLAKDVDFASYVYSMDYRSQNDPRFLVDEVANISKLQDKIGKQLEEREQKLKAKEEELKEREQKLSKRISFWGDEKSMEEAFNKRRFLDKKFTNNFKRVYETTNSCCIPSHVEIESWKLISVHTIFTFQDDPKVNKIMRKLGWLDSNNKMNCHLFKRDFGTIVPIID